MILVEWPAENYAAWAKLVGAYNVLTRDVMTAGLTEIGTKALEGVVWEGYNACLDEIAATMTTVRLTERAGSDGYDRDIVLEYAAQHGSQYSLPRLEKILDKFARSLPDTLELTLYNGWHDPGRRVGRFMAFTDRADKRGRRDIPAAAISAEVHEQIRVVALEVRVAMVEMPDEPFSGAKTIFPQVWCEWGSISLAEVLASRGFGDWTFVSAKLPDSLSGHAWLELHQDEAGPVFSIDITLDQFPEWDEPFIGPGWTPALTKFQRLDYSGPWNEWPATRGNSSFARYAKVMLEYLDAG